MTTQAEQPVAKAIPEHPQPKGRRAAAVWVPIAELKPWLENPRRNEAAVPEVVASIREFGFGAPVLVRVETDELIAGHTRLKAAEVLGLLEVPVRYMTLDELRAHALAVADNRTAEFSRWDEGLLLKHLARFDEQGSASLRRAAGYDDDALASLRRMQEAANAPPAPPPGPTLADRFLVPPFTVLDARSGFWQDRKRQWLALGLIAPKIGSDVESHPKADALQAAAESSIAKGETPDPRGLAAMKRMGRGAKAAAFAPDSGSPLPRGRVASRAAAVGRSDKHAANPKAQRGKGSMIAQVMGTPARKGRTPPSPGGSPGLDRSASASRQAPRPSGNGSSTPARAPGRYEGGDAWTGTSVAATSGTSIFDPVLCEIMLRWFCPRGGKVLDPFAGGTSLGVVAAQLGYAFTGVEVRADQVEANLSTVAKGKLSARWVCGDSATIDDAMPGGGPFDFVCTDPPYYTLERYSRDARDGSTKQSYVEFLAWYAGILKRAAGVLAKDRFFVVKIGEARDRNGHYCNIVGDTVRALTDAGLHFYNECILVTAVGSLPVRAGRAFAASRKLGKTHQQVLVMVKGDAKRAVDACGPVEVSEVPAMLDLSEDAPLVQ